MITTRPCPFAIPANDRAAVTFLDDARQRRDQGFALTDAAAPGHPRSRLRPGTFACLANGIVIRIQELAWVKSDGTATGAVLHARYIMNGTRHTVPLSDLTPSQFQPQEKAP